MFEHHGVFAGSVKIEHIIFRLWTFEDPIAEALFVPLVEVAVIAAEEVWGKIFGFGDFLKNGVQADGSAEERAKV